MKKKIEKFLEKLHAGAYTLKSEYFEEGGGPANPKKRQKTPKKMLFFAYCEK